MGAQGFFALFAKWSSPIRRSCKKRQSVSHGLRKLVGCLCKTIFAWLYSISCRWDLASESWFCMLKYSIHRHHGAPQGSALTAGILNLGKEPPHLQLLLQFPVGALSKHHPLWFFCVCSSSVHLIPASSCGAATLRTPISAKQRKGLRWTGPCVHQGRWELCTHTPVVFMCVCVQLGIFPSKSRGARKEPVWRT